MQSVIFIMGRSIDGTVFWSGNGWADSYVGAKAIRTPKAACLAIEFLREDASPCIGPDETVGGLAIHIATQDKIDAAYNAAMVAEAEWSDE